MKAVIYSRFSTDRQNESSIADQVRICTEYAIHNGMRVTTCYEDQGISGAALGNRPGVLRMQEAAMAGQFDVLLVTDLTRLSRSNGDLSKMIDRLTARGIRVIGVQDGYDSSRRGHKLQAGLSGIIGEAFREMIRDRTHAALESRAKEQRPTGGKCYGYRDGVIYEPEAAIVRRIFERFAEGATPRTIALELNQEGIPSPGASWKRTERRCDGWVHSGVRVILQNERYTGLIRWNTSMWIKDPDTGKRIRRDRPRSEWIEQHDESLRIIPDSLFRAAQERTRVSANSDKRLKSGGRAKYLLSGLLRCSVCGSHYVLSGSQIANSSAYQCSGYLGGACSNGIRVKRERVEEVILTPIREELLSPARVQRMVDEIRKAFIERMQNQARQASETPAEIKALEARIARLRERLTAGDPDMEPDEILAAIAKAEQKRQDLMAARPEAKQSAKLLTAIPRAAEEYRREVTGGLEGDPRAAARARVILRKLLGEIRLVPEPGGALWAEYEISPAAVMLKASVSNGFATPLERVVAGARYMLSSIPQRKKLK
jgi:DNA invertase Pin-like site-specific DNA recombinase